MVARSFISKSKPICQGALIVAFTWCSRRACTVVCAFWRGHARRYVVPFDRETFDHNPCDCNGRVSRYLVAGASQENDDGSGALWDAPANMSRALDLIEEELVSIYPPLNASGGSWTASHARAGIKGVPSRSVLGAIPLCGRVRMGGVLAEGGLKDKVWVFAGLGSRGLIHHAILGLALAQAILTGDEERIPAAARRIRLLGGAEE